jgi:hypothetical protein
MRYRTFSDFQEPSVFDHDILRVFTTRFNFQRIKHADRIGVTYWNSAKGDCNRTLAPVNYYVLLDGKKRSMQQQSAILEGNLELPMGAWGEQLDNLHTFVASSSKQKIVGQYVSLQLGAVQEFVPFARSCEFDMQESAAWRSPAAMDLVDNYQPDFSQWEKMAEEDERHELPAEPEPKKIRSKKSKSSRSQTGMKAFESAAGMTSIRRGRRRSSVKNIDTDKIECDVDHAEYVTA